MSDRFYMAICGECGGDPEGAAIPFSIEAERDSWAAQHGETTGHQVDTEIRILGESGVVTAIQLNVSDLCMHNELFMASPDGAAERERQRKLFDQLPDVSIEFNGYFTDGRDDRG